MSNENRNDGGPAFPSLGIPCVDASGAICQFKDGQGGMTLRDYFAAMAMPLVVNVEQFRSMNSQVFVDQAARRSYSMADAMLAAREPKTESQP